MVACSPQPTIPMKPLPYQRQGFLRFHSLDSLDKTDQKDGGRSPERLGGSRPQQTSSSGQHHHLSCDLLLEEFRERGNARRHCLIGRRIERQPQIGRRPALEDMHEAPGPQMLRDMKVGQHRNALAIRASSLATWRLTVE